MSSDEVAEWKEAFDLFANGSPSIAHYKLPTVCRSLGYNFSDAVLQPVLSWLPDPVDFDTFYRAVKQLAHQQTAKRDEAKELFQQIDVDQDGIITVPELQRFLGGLGGISKQEIQEIVEVADVNRSGRVDLAGFRYMFEESS
eukprot:EC713952.1.p1 GENE.EC713952.1~~EC713952.1.p1  ORF type:complete len:142 (+),score=12.89 EC713952.1:32-457(+)